MIQWAIDPDLYTEQELEKLLEVIEQMDYSIAKEIQDYLTEKYNT